MRIRTAFIAFVCAIGLISIQTQMLAARPAPTRAADAHPSGEGEAPFTFTNVIGTWSCAYPDHYGYRFIFERNYRALVIVYLNSRAVIFRGVYTIEQGNRLRINISHMKNEPRVVGLNIHSGFNRAKSSYFVFTGSIVKKNNRLAMHLRPAAIIIDGNSSEGYFEPLTKLSKN